MTTSTTTAKTTRIGTPAIESVPRFRNESGSVSALTCVPLVHRNARPRNMYSVPSVTTSAGTLPQVTSTPLNSPQAAPSSMPARKTSGSGRPWCLESRSPAKYALRPSTEPTERSTLRVISTSVWPAARITKIDALSARLRSEAASRNRGSRMPVTTIRTTSTSTMPSSRTRNTHSVIRRARAPSRATAFIGRPFHDGTPETRGWTCGDRWPGSCRDLTELTRGGADHRLLVGLGAGELSGQPAFVHHQDANGHAQHLRQLGGDHQPRRALAGELAQQAVDLGLGAAVDAAGRLVDDQQLRVRRQPLGEHDLLLVAARQRADDIVEPVVFELQLGAPFGRQRVLGGRADQPAVRQRPELRQRGVARDREIHHQALRPPILRDEADPRAHRRSGLAGREPPAVDLDMTGVRAVDSEDRPRHLAAAGADEPGQRDDLARAHVEADVE